jgi:hypothetical protein
MEKLIRVAVVAALLGLGIWVWQAFFPNQQKVIRSELNHIAQLASFDQNEGPMAKLANATELASFFTADAEVTVQILEFPKQIFQGHNDLVRGIMFVRMRWSSLSVEFVDINIAFEPGKQAATANLTGKIRIAGEGDFTPQELKFVLEKAGRKKWLIRRIETVKTFQ